MKRGSLAWRLMSLLIVLIIGSLSCLGILSYYYSAERLKEQVQTILAQNIKTAAFQTDQYLRTFEFASNSTIGNTDIRYWVEIDEESGPQSLFDYYSVYQQLKKYVLKPVLIYYPQTSLVYLIRRDGRIVYEERDGYQPLQTDKAAERLGDLLAVTSDDGSLSVLTGSLNPDTKDFTVSLARKVRGLHSYGIEGVLAIEFKAQELAQLWRSIDLGNGGYFFIIDEEGRLIYHPDVGMIGTKLKASLMKKLSSGATSFSDDEDRTNRLYVTGESRYAGWKLVASVPVKEWTKPIHSIRTITLWIGGVTLILAVVIAFRYIQSITRPISELREGMRETEEGNWFHLPEPKRQDEVGELIHSYNVMVTRLSSMIDRVYKSQLERQKAEFQALQLQINPHFLYNSLATINSYAIQEGARDISRMAKSMSFMLRYAVQTNLEEITVANELNHVLNYMDIMNHRLQKPFEIEVLIPPDYLLEKMVRLTLQPIVENVFHHAFPMGVMTEHYIRINANMEGSLFCLTVEDNGSGMSPERLALVRERLGRNRLTEPSKDGNGTGIGIVNVHRRIQMVFGEEYGLSINSVFGEGTRVTMRMPRIGKDEKLTVRNSPPV